jgi:hypothetical protein
LAVVEELVEEHFEYQSHLLQCFDSRDSVAIFDSENVASWQARAFFNVSLGKLLLFTQSPEAVANNQGNPPRFMSRFSLEETIDPKRSCG